jgi:hypothetical protein
VTLDDLARAIVADTDRNRGRPPSRWPLPPDAWLSIRDELDERLARGWLWGADIGESNYLVLGVPVIMRPWP